MRGDVRVEPARFDQIRQTDEGDWMVIPAEAGTVVADLKKLDAGFEVKFSKSQACWVIFHQHHSGCPHNGTGGPGSTYLVSTVQAYLSATGVWTGLDDRVVKRLEQLNPFGRGEYDYAAELERGRVQRERASRHEFQERMGEVGERAAHALRRDLGLGPYRGRIFKPRDLRTP